VKPLFSIFNLTCGEPKLADSATPFVSVIINTLISSELIENFQTPALLPVNKYPVSVVIVIVVEPVTFFSNFIDSVEFVATPL
jgi:hypothetical protein